MSAHIGVTPEFWLFGFLSTVYTNNWTLGPAIVLAIEYTASLFAVHAEEAIDAASCTELLFFGSIVHATVVMLGVLAGLAVVYATDFPNVFNADVFFSSVQRSRLMNGHLVAMTGEANGRLESDGYLGQPWKAKPYAWTLFGFVLPIIYIYISILFFVGRFTMAGAYSISQGLSNVLGAIFVSIAAVSLIAYIVVTFWRPESTRLPDGHRMSGQLNLKYGALLTLALATPVLFDFTPSLPAWARYLLHIFLALLVYMLTAFVGRYDRYFGSESAARTYLTFIAIWVLHLSVYAGSAFLTSQTSVFVWVSSWSAVWTVAAIIFGFWWRVDTRYERQLDMQDKRREAHLSKKAYTEVPPEVPPEAPEEEEVPESSPTASRYQGSLRRRSERSDVGEVELRT